MKENSSVNSSYLLGEFPPRIPNSPPQKNAQNTKNIEKCIKFTPQISVSPQNPESRINTGELPLHLPKKKKNNSLVWWHCHRDTPYKM